MNATLLLTCSLALAQPAFETPASPEFAGTFSVLVKSTSLADAAVAASSVASPSPEMVASVAEPAGPLTPITPPAQPGVSGAAEPASHVEPDPRSSLEAPRLLAAGVEAEQTAVTGRVLRELLATDQRGTPGGNPLRLRDALAGTSGRQAQLQIVSAYWQLAAAVGRYHAAVERQQRVDGWPEPADPRPLGRLQAARADAAAALREAELSAVSMQYALAELVPYRQAGPVSPADLPFVGVYQTHYDSLFATRPAPAGMFRIHQILPLRLAAIEARAAAVVSAEDVVALAEDASGAGEASLEEMVQATAAWQAQRDAFLVAVRDYNIDIAAYALAVAAENTDVETLVSMLIGAAPRVEPAPVSAPVSMSGFPGNALVGEAQVGPTLAAGPPPWQLPASAEAHAVPVTETLVTEPARRDPSAIAPAVLTAEQTEATPFRVVPTVRPEVLVPLPPARYRSVPLPAQTPAPANEVTVPAGPLGG